MVMTEMTVDSNHTSSVCIQDEDFTPSCAVPMEKDGCDGREAVMDLSFQSHMFASMDEATMTSAIMATLEGTVWGNLGLILSVFEDLSDLS